MKDDMKSQLEKLKSLNGLDKTINLKEDADRFGNVTINIIGNGQLKNRMVDEVRKSLRRFIGERHLFVDGEEVSPYNSEEGIGLGHIES